MAKEFLAISDGTFTLAETEVENQFYFYRNNGEVLGNIEHEPMEFYHAYIINKMLKGEIEEISNNIYFKTSKDGKYITLTVSDISETDKNPRHSIASKKRPNFLKRLANKIFG